MLQGPNNFKNHILRWLLRPLSLAKFESLWIQVYSLMAVLGSWKAFSLSSLFWILIDFSQGSFPLIHCCWMPFTVGCPFFYSAILKLSGVPLIYSICCPEYQNQCCVSNIGDCPLPYFLSISFFWGSFFKSP